MKYVIGRMDDPNDCFEVEADSDEEAAYLGLNEVGYYCSRRSEQFGDEEE